MIGLIVKKDGVAVEKRVYNGNDSKSLEEIESEKSKNPDKVYETYDDSKKAEFEAIQVTPERNENQKAWDVLKSKATDAEKLFAKVLGLE